MNLVDTWTGQNPGKTVAIVLGGAAAVGFLAICLLFARGLMKKHDGMNLLYEIESYLSLSLFIISFVF